MNKKNYRCEKCNESFENIKQYINHLDLHNEQLVNTPEIKEKKSFLKNLFSFNKKTTNKYKKQDMEVSNMAEEKKPEEKTTTPEQQNASRFEAMERAISELSTMVAKLSEDKTNELIIEEVKTEVPEPKKEINNSSTKSVRITVVVNEKEMPSLLKEVQENESYVMESIEVLTK